MYKPYLIVQREELHEKAVCKGRVGIYECINLIVQREELSEKAPCKSKVGMYRPYSSA